MRIRFTPTTWFVILTLIAIGLALGLPPDPQAVHQLHTSSTTFRLAVAALLIPYILIWYASFYAFAKLHEYSKPLKDTKDGAAFYKISIGVGALAFSLVIPTILSLIVNNIAAHNPGFRSAAIIINNYLSLFPGLVAFVLIYNGTRQLLSTLRKKQQQIDLRWYAPAFFVLAVIFSHLVLENSYQSDPYHLSTPLLIVTFIVPYLYGWMVGLLSAYDLYNYARSVRGLIYRRAVQRFAVGIAITILGSIAVQFVTIALAHRLDKTLGSVLLLDYCLLLIIALGLVMMALGTNKLKQIEEI